jgi:glutamate-1-semialdehyde 2,1-aminomutase
MSKRYARSEQYLKRAEKTIPLGSQTYSKSRAVYPYGVSPYFLARGKGSHVWDVDGHEYIDFVNGLASITLGYNDPDVTRAVKRQLRNGVTFSLPHPIEAVVAEQIVSMVPCAERVRFSKNGSDATSGAVRLARAVTGRDHVAVSGYHGWHDWYIGSTTRNKGVPAAVQELTHVFKYNDLDSLFAIFKRWPNQVAAVVMEPMNYLTPDPGFLESVKELTHQHKALLIFDETITGFRYANGGAQAYFKITPDLATFGKGVANGYPLSVVAGPESLMREMQEIFFSSTFGGETLSLAAASATLTQLKRRRVVDALARQGKKLIDGVAPLIVKHGLQDVLSISGHPSWSFLNFKEAPPYSLWEVKTLFLQETFARGILTLGTHNMSYSHSDADVRRLITVYDEVFAILADCIRQKTLARRLRCAPLVPLFKVR